MSQAATPRRFAARMTAATTAGWVVTAFSGAVPERRLGFNSTFLPGASRAAAGSCPSSCSTAASTAAGE